MYSSEDSLESTEPFLGATFLGMSPTDANWALNTPSSPQKASSKSSARALFLPSPTIQLTNHRVTMMRPMPSYRNSNKGG